MFGQVRIEPHNGGTGRGERERVRATQAVALSGHHDHSVVGVLVPQCASNLLRFCANSIA